MKYNTYILTGMRPRIKDDRAWKTILWATLDEGWCTGQRPSPPSPPSPHFPPLASLSTPPFCRATNPFYIKTRGINALARACARILPHPLDPPLFSPPLNTPTKWRTTNNIIFNYLPFQQSTRTIYLSTAKFRWLRPT